MLSPTNASRTARPLLLLLLLLPMGLGLGVLTACGLSEGPAPFVSLGELETAGTGTSKSEDGPPLASDPEDALAGHDLAAWRYYDGEAESPTEAALSPATWVLATVDLACAGRALHGNPKAHARASRRILTHYRTSAEAVMDFSIQLNEDAAESASLGPLVATGASRCP